MRLTCLESIRRLSCSLLLAGLCAGATPCAGSPEQLQHGNDETPPANLVEITERLHTSGQPSPKQLLSLASSGYQLVINLSPPDATGAVADEGAHLATGGIGYIHIPVDWDTPSTDEFELFSAILGDAGKLKVLVHCQSNKRASIFTFLYRTVYAGVDPEDAWENVTAIWQPDAHWLEFVQRTLQQHGMDFEPWPSE